MSIYVGDKKAKLYRGDYGPAQYYKGDVKIAGYTDTEKVGTSISGVDTYNDALLPAIEGKSEQAVTVLGRNLFDEERILPTQGWVKQSDGSFFVANNAIPYGKVLWENTDGYAGQIFVTIQTRRTEVGSPYTGAFPSIVYTDGSRSIALDFRDVEWTSNAVISDNTKTVKQIVWSYGTGAIGTYVKDLLIAKSNTVVPYEPFVPNSPSPDYPSPIRSSEEFDVVSCGRNLIGLQPQATQTQYGVAYRVENQKLLLNGFSTGNFAITFEVKCALKSGTYILSTRKYTDIAVGDFFINDLDNTPIFRTASLSPRSSSVSTSISSVKASFWCNAGVEFRDVALPLQLEEGTIATPYQPYHATTAHITDPLRSVGGVSDSIEVSEGKVEVVRRVVRFVNSASAKWVYSPSYSKNGFNCWILRVYKALTNTTNRPVMCAILKRVANIALLNQEGITHQEALDNIDALLWIKLDATKFPDTASLLAKEFYIDYVPNLPPTRTDITATPLGQALLALRTQPHYTQVYTNATLPPTIRARIKEMDM